MTTNIDKLNKALGTWEVASHIFDIDNGKTLEKCLEIAKVNNANDFGLDEDTGVRVVNRGEADWEESIDEDWVDYELDEDDGDDLVIKAITMIETEKLGDDEELGPVLKRALRHYRGARGHANIKLFQNHTKVSDPRNPLNKHNREARHWAHLAPKTYRHENIEIVTDDVEPLTLMTNEGALSMLSTAAAKTIEGKGTPSAAAVAAMLPKSWTDPNEDHTLPLGRDIETKKMLPPEWQTNKIEKSVDHSFGAQAARTKAAATIARSEKISFKDEEDASQLPSYWAREKSAPVPDGASTYKKFPNRQKQYVADLDHLQSPRPNGT